MPIKTDLGLVKNKLMLRLRFFLEIFNSCSTLAKYAKLQLRLLIISLSTVLTLGPGVTLDLKILIDSYSCYTAVLLFEKFDVASSFFVGHSAPVAPV